MSISKSETQVTWSTASSVSVTAGSNQTSDAVTVDSAVIDGAISIKCDNAGTPASGDTITVYMLPTCGDPDGASSDEYDTTTQGILLATIDTNISDPAQRTVPLPTVSVKSFKIYAVSAAGSNGITVSACVYFTTES